MGSLHNQSDHNTRGQSSTLRGGYAAGTVMLPPRDLQHAWFELTRNRTWQSLVFVPVDEHADVLTFGYEMATLAAMDMRNKVLLINATGHASDVASSQQQGLGMKDEAGEALGILSVSNPAFGLLDLVALGYDEATATMIESPRYLEMIRHGEIDFSMVLICVAAVTDNPAMVSASRVADSAALFVSLGKATLAQAKRTCDLIGQEKIIGAISVDPATTV